MKIYQHKREVWDRKKCSTLAKRVSSDAFGTKHHLPGFLPGLRVGTFTYNGGCVIEGKWYEGENFPIPKVPEGYEIYYEPTWFWRIREKEEGE